MDNVILNKFLNKLKMKQIFENLFAKAQRAFQKGTVIILCTLLIGFIMTVSCEKPKAPNTNQSDDPALETTQDTTFAVAGTTWKLVSIVNTQTGKITELEPRNCDSCYTLTFITDTKVVGLSFSVKIGPIDLSLLGSYVNTYIGEDFDGYKYRRLMFNPNTNSYIVNSTELKIVNKIENYYLLFNPYSYENE
jgi:hypothetical protein